MHFRKVTLVGVGLLGGSLGLALRRRGLADEVQGFVRRASSVAECLALGVVDRCSRSLVEAVTDADLVVLCSPVGQMPDLFREMSRHLSADCLVTDVGSVKSDLVAEVEPLAQAAGFGLSEVIRWPVLRKVVRPTPGPTCSTGRFVW